MHWQQTFSQIKCRTNLWFPTSSKTWCTSVITNNSFIYPWLHYKGFLTLVVWLGHSPPNLCGTIRNIHLHFILLLGMDFQHKSPGFLIAKSFWKYSSHNWSFLNFLTSLYHTYFLFFLSLIAVFEFKGYFVFCNVYHSFWY